MIRQVFASRRNEREPIAAADVAFGMPHQMRPGSRVVTSWTSHALPSGSLKAKNDP